MEFQGDTIEKTSIKITVPNKDSKAAFSVTETSKTIEIVCLKTQKQTPQVRKRFCKPTTFLKVKGTF